LGTRLAFKEAMADLQSIDRRAASLARTMRAAAAVAALSYAVACATAPPQAPPPVAKPHAPTTTTAVVTASAYNSHADQTDGDPTLTASGRRLQPGMRALAVSPDLFVAGIDFGTRVRIEGVDGEWTVLDRMPADRRRAIDLYFGTDEAAALRFGKKRVRIDWNR
jgi:3D (Asp-Asp-Asp) domain-containing protein